MTIETLTTFFGWCTLINFLFLIYVSVITVFARGWVYKMQKRWFPVTEEFHTAAMFSFLGLLKIFVLIFNLTPWLVLKIMG